MSKVMRDEPNLIIGIDIPDYILGFKRNENILKTLNGSQAICAGHIMWELTKSGAITGIEFFNYDSNIEKNNQRDLDFGKIIAQINVRSGCRFPDEYTKAFDEGFKNKTIDKEDSLMVANVFGKMAIALTMDYTLKVVENTKCSCCGK